VEKKRRGNLRQGAAGSERKSGNPLLSVEIKEVLEVEGTRRNFAEKMRCFS